jgi:hypothetical protein
LFPPVLGLASTGEALRYLKRSGTGGKEGLTPVLPDLSPTRGPHGVTLMPAAHFFWAVDAGRL